MRIAVIDSGVHVKHPHIGGIAGGIHIKETGVNEDYTDYLGHGTAVTAAIHEKVPDAQIYVVKVFDRQLMTSGDILLRALDWCLNTEVDFVNLSLGTRNGIYVPAFEERIATARERGAAIVSAHEMNGEPAFPGSLAGVYGVVLDNECPRDRYREKSVNGKTVFAAAGFPRPISGVPPERNLQGISFAVANVTGLLAAEGTSACLSR